MMIKPPVKRLIFMRPQFVDDGLNAEHEQFITQVQPELEIVFSRAVIEHGV